MSIWDWTGLVVTDIALINNNASVGASIAVELAKLRKSSNTMT